MKHFILITAVIILMAGCKKKEPLQVNEPPVFSFTGKMNGNPVSYFSGANGYYMYSSYQDTNNLREFIGTLKTFGCGDVCSNSIKLRIKDYRTLSSTATSPDTSIAPLYYAYSTPSGAPAAYSVTFSPQFTGGGPAQSYLWTFHDGSTSTLSAPVKQYPRNGIYNVCVSITSSTSSCVGTICNIVKVGQTGDALDLAIFNSAMAGTAVTFTAAPFTGTAPFTYLWDFGDGNTSMLGFPTHTYSANGVYPVTLTITDIKGKTGTVIKNVGTQVPGTCYTNFNTSKFALNNTLNLSNLVLEWTDQNGITYTSENNSQPASGGFRIISVENYKPNSSGQKTKKIRAILNCTLYSGTTTVLIEDAELVFAVAYP